MSTDRILGEAVERKRRGAFFTPPSIAEFLVKWAVTHSDARVLDPTCGEAVFLAAAGEQLRSLGKSTSDLDSQVFGVDIHRGSLEDADRLLTSVQLDARLIPSDFFDVKAPDQLGCELPLMDAVVGNPPFVRYHHHAGQTRKLAAEAALHRGVRLSGLASSWAPLLVHASAFLKPEGRLAMVLPAELLTVHYAEPIRQWLRRRFEAVNLVVFEKLQFEGALENVVLLLARGSGGCDAFSLFFADDADSLSEIAPFEGWAVTPAVDGKWTDLLLPTAQRQLFRSALQSGFEELQSHGTVGLGTVTGANEFFTLTEDTRAEYEIHEEEVVKISPPGTRHLSGTAFSTADWRRLRDAGERVWLVQPESDSLSVGLRRYLAEGEDRAIHKAYKCQVRDPWWRPPLVPTPDLFFTYMSHRFPRLINNSARVAFVNSMHGVWLNGPDRRFLRMALPLLAMNSVTLLGAEVFGRSYGGGVLKMEPREAATLPVPSLDAMHRVWNSLGAEHQALERELQHGRWTTVLARIDQVLLSEALGMHSKDVEHLHEAAKSLRARRMNRKPGASVE